MTMETGREDGGRFYMGLEEGEREIDRRLTASILFLLTCRPSDR
jgi:hypothetical protein